MVVMMGDGDHAKSCPADIPVEVQSASLRVSSSLVCPLTAKNPSREPTNHDHHGTVTSFVSTTEILGRKQHCTSTLSITLKIHTLISIAHVNNAVIGSQSGQKDAQIVGTHETQGFGQDCCQ